MYFEAVVLYVLVYVKASSLDLLIDGLQLFLQHDGQSLHVRLSAGGQQLGAEPGLPVVLVVGATHIQARLEPCRHESPALPVWVLYTESTTVVLP